MDELVVYDPAITEDEIVRVMNAKDFFAVDASGKLTTWDNLSVLASLLSESRRKQRTRIGNLSYR